MNADVIMQIVTKGVLACVVVAAVTDILVQVIKGVFPKVPTNVLVMIVSIIVAVILFFIGVPLSWFTFTWYNLVIAVFVGFVAAFIGMYGYDKLMQTIEQWKKGIPQQ